jgi:glycosyltransferase involved in cell wall biosynthesis
MVIVQLMASPFFGGPERQMLGLARSLPAEYRTAFLTFAERGLSQALIDEVKKDGFEAVKLEHNAPHVQLAVREVAKHLRRLRADVLCCSGYKPDIIGCLAARQVGVPVVSVAHGWTAATLKVRCYEALDRYLLRWMDAVVCVSEAQAAKVRKAGVAEDRLTVIRNAVGPEAFVEPDAAFRKKLLDLFPVRPRQVVGAAGRLSPEKGFDQLVEAAALVKHGDTGVGFVVFGEGSQRSNLTEMIRQRGLEATFVLPGFRSDLVSYLPNLDVAVLPSFTEGLPVALLEFFAAGVPVVATAVGGIPEVVEEGKSGYLVPPGDPAELACRIRDVLSDETTARAMGRHGQERVRREFTFAVQSQKYQQLFARLSKDAKGSGSAFRARASQAASAIGVR